MPRTEWKGQASFSPFGQREVSVLTELALGHLRYHLADLPPKFTAGHYEVLFPLLLKNLELNICAAAIVLQLLRASYSCGNERRFLLLLVLRIGEHVLLVN